MIKKYVKILLGVLPLLGTEVLVAQSTVDFESLPLDSTGYWNGSDESGGFDVGEAFFQNEYDTTWGSWAGFAYSNLTDTVTAGYLNPYSTIAGAGYSSSATFAIAYYSAYNSSPQLDLDVKQQVQGFYTTNSTWAALSMRNGDAVAKKFGEDTLSNGSDTTYTGEPVTNADWFKLTISGLLNDSLSGASVDFFLADFRFADDAQDYIVEDWKWVDLTSLGEVDGLRFELSSSDTGQYGMNTPAYFCMDNLVIGEDTALSKNEQIGLGELVSFYPNPVQNVIHLKVPVEQFSVAIQDNLGQLVLQSTDNRLVDVSQLTRGVYYVTVQFDGFTATRKLIKK